MNPGDKRALAVHQFGEIIEKMRLEMSGLKLRRRPPPNILSKLIRTLLFFSGIGRLKRLIESVTQKVILLETQSPNLTHLELKRAVSEVKSSPFPGS